MADSAELTARDVFEQIDRRLTRLEDDLRDFRQYVEQRFQFIEQRFISLEAKLDARFATIDAASPPSTRRSTVTSAGS